MGAGRWVCWLMCTLLPLMAEAQQPQLLLQKKIRIAGGAYSLDAIDNLVFEQTGLRFSFNTGKLNTAQNILLPQKQYTLQELITGIGRHTGTTYVLYKEHIIFRSAGKPGRGKDAARATTLHAKAGEARRTGKNKPVSAVAGNSQTGSRLLPESKNKSPRSAAGNAAPQPGYALRNETDTVPTVAVNAVNTGVPAAFRNDLGPVPTLRVPVIVIPGVHSLPASKESLHYRPEAGRRRSRPSLFLGAGLLADDVLYVQPVLKAGIPAIHVMAGWATNFRASGFRYGVGSSIPLRNDWYLHIEATTGKLKGRPVPIDSTRELVAKSSLHRVGLLIGKELNARLTVAGGPVFNHLSTAYYLNGRRQSLVSMGLDDRYNDGNLYTVKPLYTISNNFDAARPIHVKTWVGLQLSLFYRFNF